jgi:glycine cleavage system aminomethyltransferase T
MNSRSDRSLHDLLGEIPDLVDYFRNDTVSPHGIYSPRGVATLPEYTNWRDEQRAWRESALLSDMSHHMPEMLVRGPDAQNLLSDLSFNSFATFQPLRAKQYFCADHEGHVIGESLLQLLEDGTYQLISGMYVQNWAQYNAEAGGYDVSIEQDMPSADNPKGRARFRFQLEGPAAREIFTEAIEGEMPDIKFFHMAKVRVAGSDAHVLRHGMAGHMGVELSGPAENGERVRAHLLDIGEKYGIRRAGTKSQFSAIPESGWIGYPVPAIYTDPRLDDYRKWLPADGWEARTQLGGSFVVPTIEEYYVTPWDLNVSKLIKFDHDFVGRGALEQMAERDDHGQKVTLIWNDDDVSEIQRSLLQDDVPYKYLDFPRASYSFQAHDEVRTPGGDLVGRTTYTGYTVNEKKVLSVAMVDGKVAEPGTEVEIVWGEPHGGSRKPAVERHRQKTVRAIVAPAPYATAARINKNAALVKQPVAAG